MSQQPTSTPRKRSSKKEDTGPQHATPPRSQDQMMGDCEVEIGAHTWEFDSLTISRMLSPKTLRKGVDAEDVESCEDLGKCDCSVDYPFFQQALDQVTSDLSNTMFEWAPNGLERESYPLFVTFLNTCIDKCHSALDSQPGAPARDNRWYSNLRFVVYDKQMADGVEGSHPLKPDCAGGRGLQNGVAKLCWNTSNHKGIPQLDLPAEVKSNWRQLLKQAAVYGRCLFSASPTRSWSLVLGFNQKSKSLRFLIFHRGGCTASKDINLDDQEGRKDAYRLILTILLWTEPYHAGFNSFSTDKEFAVPSDDIGKEHVLLKVVKTLYHTIAIRSRATLVALVSSTNASEEPEASPQLVPSARAVRRSARLQAKPATSQPTEQSAAGSAGVSRPSQRGSQPGSSAANRKGANVVGTSTSKVSDAAEKTGGHSHCSERGDEQSSAAMADEPVVSDLPWIIPGDVRLSLKYTQPLRISTGLLPTGIRAALLKTLILKLYWPDDKDDVEGELMKATCGAFGTPSHIYSYGPMDPSGLLVSNNIFLPADNPESIGNAWWKVFSHDVRDCPEHPNYRAAHIILLGAVGLSLLSATSSWALCEAIVHALLGWLTYYQHGYMHRDVSIGNVLQLEKPVKMKPFEILEAFAKQDDSLVSKMEELSVDDTQVPHTPPATSSHGAETVDTPDTTVEGMPTNSAVASAIATASPGTAEYATQIKELVGKLGITGDCKAILTDGDMAAKWETYFDETHNWRTRSGTPEFMSFYLQTAMEGSDDQYLQSPVDDLHSFFWVTLWAVMFNGLNRTRSIKEKRWQGNLVGSAASKLSVPYELRPSTGNSPITEQMKPLLRDWYNAMQGLNDDWSVVSRLPDGIEAREWYLPHFHHFAFRGVVETLELMLKHHSTLLKYPPFPST